MIIILFLSVSFFRPSLATKVIRATFFYQNQSKQEVELPAKANSSLLAYNHKPRDPDRFDSIRSDRYRKQMTFGKYPSRYWKHFCHGVWRNLSENENESLRKPVTTVGVERQRQRRRRDVTRKSVRLCSLLTNTT